MTWRSPRLVMMAGVAVPVTMTVVVLSSKVVVVVVAMVVSVVSVLSAMAAET
jgi:hypothetical protein